MEAKKNGGKNPFADIAHSLAWITSAMDAARRHKERMRDPFVADDRADERPRLSGELH